MAEAFWQPIAWHSTALSFLQGDPNLQSDPNPHTPPAPSVYRVETRSSSLSRGRLVFAFAFERAEHDEERLQRRGLEVEKLQAHIEASGSGRGLDGFNPNDLGGVRNRRRVLDEELHLEKLADLHWIVAIDTNSPEADVNRLALSGEEIHPRGAAIERRTDTPILATVLFAQGKASLTLAHNCRSMQVG
jgi:hypothetical protein